MFDSILVPVKLTKPIEAERAVKIASKLAREFDALLTLATITPHWVTLKDADYSWEARRWFESRAAIGLERLKLLTGDARCRTLSRWGSVPGSILDIAEEVDADLIVLNADKSKFANFLHQPDSGRLASRASCSVFLIR